MTVPGLTYPLYRGNNCLTRTNHEPTHLTAQSEDESHATWRCGGRGVCGRLMMYLLVRWSSSDAQEPTVGDDVLHRLGRGWRPECCLGIVVRADAVAPSVGKAPACTDGAYCGGED